MRIYPPNIHSQHLLSPLLLPHNHFPTPRRPKYPRHVCPSSLDFNNLITQLPSLTSTSFLTLGFASAFAIYLSNPKQLVKNLTKTETENKDENIDENIDEDGELGEWILFTSPTPFNRFVMLRCPSICFEGGGVSVNERLVKEERHFVRLSSGGMRVRVREGVEVGYTRVCVGAEDGGVVAIDWPGELELEEERGLDFTVVIVAGTGEGSGERCMREFVGECLRRGCFPVVMNPRGCGGSPLTTAR